MITPIIFLVIHFTSWSYSCLTIIVWSCQNCLPCHAASVRRSIYSFTHVNVCLFLYTYVSIYVIIFLLILYMKHLCFGLLDSCVSWLTTFFLYYSFMFSFNSHSYLRTFSFVPLNTLPTTRFSFLLSSVWQSCIHLLINT